MRFHDSTRTKLGNWRPCWLNSHIALPPFQLEPHPTDSSLVTVTICHGARGIWLSKDIPLTELLKTFHFWSEDPEGTFMSLFGLPEWPQQPERTPKKEKATGISTPISLEDLI
jgi:hypothetical protein